MKCCQIWNNVYDLLHGQITGCEIVLQCGNALMMHFTINFSDSYRWVSTLGNILQISNNLIGLCIVVRTQLKLNRLQWFIKNTSRLNNRHCKIIFKYLIYLLFNYFIIVKKFKSIKILSSVHQLEKPQSEVL